MNREDADGTLRLGRARARARRPHRRTSRSACTRSTRWARCSCSPGISPAATKLERSTRSRDEAGLEVDVARGYGHLAWAALRNREYATVDAALAAGLDYCAEPQPRPVAALPAGLPVALAARSGPVDRGGRDGVGRPGRPAHLVDPPHPRAASCSGSSARGAAIRGCGGRARRGARLCAAVSEELQRIGPVAAARAEVAWLRGDRDGVARGDRGRARARARARRADGSSASSRCGAGARASRRAARRDVAEPYARQLAGDWGARRRRWAAVGRPYEAALALADGDDGRPAPRAGTAARARRRARRRRSSRAACVRAARAGCAAARGARRATTRRTSRRARSRCWRWSSRGCATRRSPIGSFVSAKTVDHHVGAILRKLGVHTRGEAGAAARRLGLAPDDD